MEKWYCKSLEETFFNLSSSLIQKNLVIMQKYGKLDLFT